MIAEKQPTWTDDRCKSEGIAHSRGVPTKRGRRIQKKRSKDYDNSLVCRKRALLVLFLVIVSGSTTELLVSQRARNVE